MMWLILKWMITNFYHCIKIITLIFKNTQKALVNQDLMLQDAWLIKGIQKLYSFAERGCNTIDTSALLQTLPGYTCIDSHSTKIKHVNPLMKREKILPAVPKQSLALAYTYVLHAINQQAKHLKKKNSCDDHEIVVYHMMSRLTV